MYNQISSRDNPLVKFVIRLLADANCRWKNKLTVISGRNLIIQAHQYNLLVEVLVSKTKLEKYANVIKKLRQPIEGDDSESLLPQIHALNEKIINKIDLVENGGDLIGLIKIKPGRLSDNVYNEDCIVLENISDPGNLGTILRAAGAVGIKNVILNKNSVDVYSPKVLRSSAGIQFSLNILSGIEITDFLAKYQGNILATTPHTDSNIYKVDLTKITAWVFGNEANGISLNLLQQITNKVKIPMSDNAESLNVAMAATVCLFEMQRQRELC